MVQEILENDYEEAGLLPPIASLYDKKSVLITSIAEPDGMVLLEKLLFSVPGIKTIFVLLFLEGGSNITKGELFDRIRAKDAKLLEKVIPLKADVDEEKLGMSDDDYDRVCKEVSIVFHNNSTETPSYDIQAELFFLDGAKHVIELCKKMPNLECYCHVSSAYANCDKERVSEHVYPAACVPEEAENMANKSGNDSARILDGRFPDGFTFAHNIAEAIVAVEAASLPILIFRPSFIDAIYRDNIPGWTKAFSPLALVASWVGLGTMGFIPGRRETRIESVPVDYVVNMMIVAAATRIHANEKGEMGIRVLHCASGSLKPITLGRIVDSSAKFFTENPVEIAVGTPRLSMFSNEERGPILGFLLHDLPAFVHRWWLKAQKYAATKSGLFSLRGRMTLEQERIIGGCEYFFNRSWDFETKEMLKLWASLSAEDQETFHFDVRTIDTEAYLICQYWGIRKHLLREDKDTIERGRARLKQLQMRRIAVRFAVVAVVLLLLTLLVPRLWISLVGIAFPLAAYFYIFAKEHNGNE